MQTRMPSTDELARAMPSADNLMDMLPGADDFHLPASNDFLRAEVLGGAAMVAAAFFLPPTWRVAAGVVGGALIGYGLFVQHGPRYPSERRGREYYSTYGDRHHYDHDDELVDSMSMDSFPTSDPPATY